MAARIPISWADVAVVQRDQLDSAKLRWRPSDRRWSLDVPAAEGELHLLASAWRDAEEIAATADEMFLPPSIDETIARLKRDIRTVRRSAVKKCHSGRYSARNRTCSTTAKPRADQARSASSLPSTLCSRI